MFKPVLSTSITPSRAQLQSIGGSEENRSGVTAGGKTDMKSQVLDTRLNLMTALMGQQWATKWHHNNTNSMQLQPKREPCQVGQPEFNLSVQRTEIALNIAASIHSEIGSSVQNSVEMTCSIPWHLAGISNSESYTVD